ADGELERFHQRHAAGVHRDDCAGHRQRLSSQRGRGVAPTGGIASVVRQGGPDPMSVLGIVMTGDLMMLTPGSVDQYQNDAGFQAVRDLLHGVTAAANLEVPLSCRGEPVPKTFNLRAPPAVIGDLAALGITAVTLANNHVMDYGPESLADTLAASDEAG